MTSFTCVPRRTRPSPPSCGVPGLLDVRSVAARLKVSDAHVRLLVRHQRIPYVRHGHRVGFEPRRIDAWLAASPHSHAENHASDGEVAEQAAVPGEDTA